MQRRRIPLSPELTSESLIPWTTQIKMPVVDTADPSKGDPCLQAALKLELLPNLYLTRQ